MLKPMQVLELSRIIFLLTVFANFSDGQTVRQLEMWFGLKINIFVNIQINQYNGLNTWFLLIIVKQ